MARIALALTLALTSTAAAAADCPLKPQGLRLDRDHGGYEHATYALSPFPSIPVYLYLRRGVCVGHRGITWEQCCQQCGSAPHCAAWTNAKPDSGPESSAVLTTARCNEVHCE
jgi:hypothetical protein